MEISIIGLISSLIKEGTLSQTTLLLIIILILGLIYRQFLNPILKKVNNAHDKESFEKALNNSNASKIMKLEELAQKLTQLLDGMSTIKGFSKENSKELEEMKRDVEIIKSILNQFQGHLLYNNASSFGNKELK